jgi:hypothetical protein
MRRNCGILLADFTVRQKAVVESQRVLPVTLGIPVPLGAEMVCRR